MNLDSLALRERCQTQRAEVVWLCLHGTGCPTSPPKAIEQYMIRRIAQCVGLDSRKPIAPTRNVMRWGAGKGGQDLPVVG